MKILVLSDSHGTLYYAKKAISNNPEVDVVIHLGDFLRDAKKLKAIFPGKIFEMIPGNSDFATDDNPAEKILEYEGKRILITHGHKYLMKADFKKLCIRAIESKIDLILFGHTHVAEIIEFGKFILVNPGSISFPRTSASKSYSLIDIIDDKISAKMMFLDKI
ncbi:MAG: metallophosphoesterase [Clostridia bacterium]|jgi:hypothetical protein